MGLRLIGRLKVVVERVWYTVVSPDEISDLPDRSLDYIWFVGGDSLAAMGSFGDSLIRRHTKIIALDDDQLYNTLRASFPDNKVFRGWAMGGFSTPNPDTEPNLVRVDAPAPNLCLESRSDDDLLTLMPVIKILRKAGLATFTTRTGKPVMAHLDAGGASIHILTTFVNLGVHKKLPPPRSPRV